MRFQLRAATFLVFEEIIAVVVFRFKETTLLIIIIPADSAETHTLFTFLWKGVIVVVIVIADILLDYVLPNKYIICRARRSIGYSINTICWT